MKTYTIIYKDGKKGSWIDERRQGKTKKEIKEVYTGNGFIVIAVLTDSDIEKIHAIDYDTVELYHQSKIHTDKKYYLYVKQVLESLSELERIQADILGE